MDINERMFTTMKEKKITQEQLANALNTSQSVVAGWKNRGTVPSMEYLPTICEVLGVSWEYLVLGEEKEQQYTSEDSQAMELFRTLPYEAKNDAIKFLNYQHYKYKNTP